MLHTCCVFAGTEDGDLTGGSAERFLTFVALLALGVLVIDEIEIVSALR